MGSAIDAAVNEELKARWKVLKKQPNDLLTGKGYPIAWFDVSLQK